MTFLKQQNKRNAGIKIEGEKIFATGKNVIVIGGGDTGSDCICTSNRHGAKSVTHFAIIPKHTAKSWPGEVVLLAMGFTGPEATLSEQLGLKTDFRSNYQASETEFQTTVPHIFTAGDMRRGQSLIVWAISEGREA